MKEHRSQSRFKHVDACNLLQLATGILGQRLLCGFQILVVAFHSCILEPPELGIGVSPSHILEKALQPYSRVSREVVFSTGVCWEDVAEADKAIVITK